MSDDVTPILLLGAGRMGGALIAGWTDAGAFRADELMAVEPQVWLQAAAQYAPQVAWDAVIVSIAAGVRAADIAEAFGGRRVARIMPTTAVAIRQGTASIYAPDEHA